MSEPQQQPPVSPTLEQTVIAQATTLGKKIATAESCTGGFIAHRLTNVPGAAAVFLQGWVTYANEAKMRELGVPAQLIETHGAVSEPVAAAMAAGALRMSGADLAISVTGIAGPDGGTPEKPVGTVWLGLARKDGGAPQTRHEWIKGDRMIFKEKVADLALEMLLNALRS
jgi:nicotinamide-nucleotide amidase